MEKIKLTNIDGKDIGEYITSGVSGYILHSPYGDREITSRQMEAIVKQHTNVTPRDIGYIAGRK